MLKVEAGRDERAAFFVSQLFHPGFKQEEKTVFSDVLRQKKAAVNSDLSKF